MKGWRYDSLSTEKILELVLATISRTFMNNWHYLTLEVMHGQKEQMLLYIEEVHFLLLCLSDSLNIPWKIVEIDHKM